MEPNGFGFADIENLSEEFRKSPRACKVLAAAALLLLVLAFILI